MIVDNKVKDILNSFSYPKTQFGFGKVIAPIMYTSEYKDGKWHEGTVKPYAPINIDPAAKALHYAQSIFEGLKAYKTNINRPANFFRPEQNYQRLNKSAQQLCMPSLDKHIFFESINTITTLCDSLIPNGTKQSLYLRPFMFGTQAQLGMAASDSYLYVLIASPSEIYHTGDMKVLVEREHCRSAIGGTGAIKAGVNYAMSLYSARKIQALGYHQSLWLDPQHQTYVEELSGMNVFAVVNETLLTPKLNHSFLPGITRDSLITHAQKEGYTVTEVDIHIDELIDWIKNGQCTELFACGTAAIVSSICAVGDGNEHYLLSDEHPVAQHLFKTLLSIQEARQPDPYGWIEQVNPSYLNE